MSNMSDNSENSDDKSQSGYKDDLCRDFLRNVCKRGKRCKYRHPDPGEARELGKRQEYTFCHDFQNAGCRRTNCKFIHCSREEEDYYKQTGQLPVRLQQAAALGIGVFPNQELPLLKGEVPICKDYLKGECKRAGRCKFRHITATEYEYELRRSERRARAAPTVDRYETFNNDHEFDTYDYDHGSLASLKRRRTDYDDLDEEFSRFRSFRTAADFRVIEDENIMLRRKVEELKKQVQDLTATNEVLLEQNARFRTSKNNSLNTVTNPLVTVSQVVTPTMTPIAAVARVAAPQPLNVINTCTTLPQIALNSNSELVVSQQAQTMRMAPDLAQQAATLSSATINPPVSIGSMVPVSLPVETITPHGSIGSLATLQSTPTVTITATPSAIPASIPQSIISGPDSTLVSYPIMSHSVITQHTPLTNSGLTH